MVLFYLVSFQWASVHNSRALTPLIINYTCDHPAMTCQSRNNRNYKLWSDTKNTHTQCPGTCSSDDLRSGSAPRSQTGPSPWAARRWWSTLTCRDDRGPRSVHPDSGDTNTHDLLSSSCFLEIVIKNWHLHPCNFHALNKWFEILMNNNPNATFVARHRAANQTDPACWFRRERL